jgi:hypothetical protein
MSSGFFELDRRSSFHDAVLTAAEQRRALIAQCSQAARRSADALTALQKSEGYWVGDLLARRDSGRSTATSRSTSACSGSTRAPRCPRFLPSWCCCRATFCTKCPPGPAPSWCRCRSCRRWAGHGRCRRFSSRRSCPRPARAFELPAPRPHFAGVQPDRSGLKLWQRRGPREVQRSADARGRKMDARSHALQRRARRDLSVDDVPHHGARSAGIPRDHPDLIEALRQIRRSDHGDRPDSCTFSPAFRRCGTRPMRLSRSANSGAPSTSPRAADWLMRARSSPQGRLERESGPNWNPPAGLSSITTSIIPISTTRPWCCWRWSMPRAPTGRRPAAKRAPALADPHAVARRRLGGVRRG